MIKSKIERIEKLLKERKSEIKLFIVLKELDGTINYNDKIYHSLEEFREKNNVNENDKVSCIEYV